MERTDKICDKDEAAYQQTYDHEIARKALHGHARKLLDADSDLMLVEEFGDPSFGHASLHLPYNLWATPEATCVAAPEILLKCNLGEASELA